MQPSKLKASFATVHTVHTLSPQQLARQNSQYSTTIVIGHCCKRLVRAITSNGAGWPTFHAGKNMSSCPVLSCCRVVNFSANRWVKNYLPRNLTWFCLVYNHYARSYNPNQEMTRHDCSLDPVGEICKEGVFLVLVQSDTQSIFNAARS